jgi:hypothetical protein
MKKLQRFCAAVVLAFILTLSAFAGDIGMPGATATGDIQAPGVVALDPVTEAALSLLQSLLSLF